MTQTLFNESEYCVREKLKKQKVICISVALAAFMVNCGLMLIRTKEISTLIFYSNVLIDLVAGWGIAFHILTEQMETRKILKLYKEHATEISGQVTSVSNHTERYHGFDCYVVWIGDRRVFQLKNGAIQLKVGSTVRAVVGHNIVREVEC